jgi:hypothetical protein
MRVMEPARSLPSSGWPRRSDAKGSARSTSTSVPAMAAASGLRVIIPAHCAKRRDGSTCSGFFGRRRRANAPISVGSTVMAPTATAAMMIAEPMPILPTNGMPVASRPAIATMTIAPAATTDVPAVAFATRAECATVSPLASCSR